MFISSVGVVVMVGGGMEERVKKIPEAEDGRGDEIGRGERGRKARDRE